MSRRLLITLGFPPALGGMQNFLYARCLAAGLDDITVLAPAMPGCRAFDQAQPFQIRRWSSRLNQIRWLGQAEQFGLPLLHALVLYRRTSFDIIECGQALPLGLIAWLFKHVSGTPYVIWSYGREIRKPMQHPVLGSVLRIVLREADLVVAVSENTRQGAIKLGVPPNRVRVIHPPVDAQRFTPDVNGTHAIARHGLEGKKVVLTVGRLVRRKGIDTVIGALPAIIDVIPDVAYVIVGDGPDRHRLETRAQALGVANHVHFADQVGDDELPAYYAACDVFVMVSRSIPEAGEVEGFGIVYLEAGACGKPVVAGRSGGVAEAVQDGVSGLLVDPSNMAAVTDAVIRVLRDPALAMNLGAAGRRRAQHSPNWDVLDMINDKANE